MAFCWRVCCISEMSAVVGLAVGFDGELWIGGVTGVGDVDIYKAREGKVGGSVSVRCTENVFAMEWLG